MTARRFDAIVVGAGYSGATTARDLGDHGHSVLVLEASDHLGGRAWTRPFQGEPTFEEPIEVGGMWIHLDLQPAVAAEVSRYSIELKDPDELPPSRAVFYVGGERRQLPVPAAELPHLEAAMLHVYDASRRLSTGYAVHSQSVSDLDISAAEFFAPLNLPPNTKDAVYAAIAAYAGVDPDAASMLHILGKVAAYGYRPYATLFGGGPVGAQGEAMFRYGASELACAMLRDSGADVRTSSRVTRIEHSRDGVVVTTEGGDTFHANACVVAVPGNAIASIEYVPGLGPAKSDVIAHKHRGRQVKALAIIEGLTDTPICFGTGPLHFAMPLRRIAMDRILYAGFAAADLFEFDPTDRVQVESAFRQFLPEARVVASDGHDWNTDPYCQGAFEVDAPGRHWFTPKVMAQPEGRVMFSGSDLDESIWRVSFESAIRSGHRAAAWANGLLRENHDDRTTAVD